MPWGSLEAVSLRVNSLNQGLRVTVVTLSRSRLRSETLGRRSAQRASERLEPFAGGGCYRGSPMSRRKRLFTFLFKRIVTGLNCTAILDPPPPPGDPMSSSRPSPCQNRLTDCLMFLWCFWCCYFFWFCCCCCRCCYCCFCWWWWLASNERRAEGRRRGAT